MNDVNDIIRRMHESVDDELLGHCNLMSKIIFGKSCFENEFYKGAFKLPDCENCRRLMHNAIDVMACKYKIHEVIDSTGEPIHIGDEMYSINSNNSGTVKDIVPHWEYNVLMGACWYAAKDLRHKEAEEDVVLDADGVPIYKGDVVYGRLTGKEHIVKNIYAAGYYDWAAYEDGGQDPVLLITHVKPYFTSDNKKIELDDILYGNDGVEWKVYGFDEDNESYPIMGINKYNGKRGLKPKWLRTKKPLDEEIVEFKLNKYKDRFEKLGIQWCDIEYVHELMDKKEWYETDNW